MKLYKKGNDYATWKIDETWQEFEDEIVETPVGTQLKSYTLTQEYQNKVLKYNIQKQIQQLKQNLNQYDYIGTKIATGRATREDYAAQIEQMNDWANQIDELENQLKGVKDVC